MPLHTISVLSVTDYVSVSTSQNWSSSVSHFRATVCKTIRPMLSDRCPVCPVCDVGLLWPNGWTDQDET